jgi:hypothetical protein
VKRLFALLAAFSFMVIVGATLNIAQANPSIQASATETPTATATEISTDPCNPLPQMITEQIAPEGKAIFAKKTRIKLRWTEVECANKYRILVRRDTRNGLAVARGHTDKTKFFVELLPGYRYFWDIKSCHNKICNRSSQRQFTILAPTATPTFTPSRTPSRTPTKKATVYQTPIPKGTQSPKVDLGRIANFQGNAVYLHDDPNQLWYRDCGSNRYIRQNSPIHMVAIGFRPFEQVKISYEILAVQGRTTYALYIADENGNVGLGADLPRGPAGHYHWWFEAGSADYCGHHDTHTPGSSGTERDPHP